MFNIGFSELVILAIIGIIVIGPEQLPEMARKLAKILNELKRAKEEIMSPVEEFKNEALRAVEKVKSDVEKVRSQVTTEINNQVSEVMNRANKADVSAPVDDVASTPKDKGDHNGSES